ncbi:DUF5694 domain-containing protein [Aquimarina hainanensis]|uniref:DUF5694 domain-containing protein n=1 Tax=Aquimarina hainanensis TaxID=1578017 RepID=A0ABW5N6H5_9FLAO
MKKLIYGITLLILPFSCISQENRAIKKSTSSKQENLVIKPEHFIGKHKAKVMILGIFHFNNPNFDSYKKQYSFDILKESRQKELEILLHKIAKYNPTKILIESDRIKMNDRINEQYQQYVHDSYDITSKRDETYQIAFKLAKKLKHDKIYCTDAPSEWFGANLDWDSYNREAYLKSTGQYNKTSRYDYNALYRLHDSLTSTQSLTEHLTLINTPSNRLKDHQAYLTETILEGAGDHYVGADSVGRWYRRNLRIFANAYDLTNFDQQERLLLIYGAGHVWQLRQFFTDSPDFDYIETNSYLTK